MAHLVEPEDKYAYPHEQQKGGSPAKERTGRPATDPVDEAEVEELVCEGVGDSEHQVAAGHDEGDGQHFPRRAEAVDLPLGIPM